MCCVLALAVGCKGKPKHQEPPANVELPAGSGSSTVPKAAADIVLPAGPGTPPIKTIAPLTPATFKKLAAMKFPGFFPELKGLDESFFEIRQKTEDHPRIWATITIQPCVAGGPATTPATGSAATSGSAKTPAVGSAPAAGSATATTATGSAMAPAAGSAKPAAGSATAPAAGSAGGSAAAVAGPGVVCTPMELAKWVEKKEALKEFLMPEIKDLPDTDFSVGATELHGQTMIWTHQLAYHMGPEGGAYTNAYILYYNDGVNQIRVVSEYKDDPASKENMLKLTPKQDLENVAKAFLDVYTHAWN